MSEKLNAVTLKMYVKGQIAVGKIKRTLLEGREGGVSAEQGLIIAGVAALVILVFSVINAYAKDEFMPALKNKITEAFNQH
ncbi:hypothetical protein U6B65_14740 (plasmid) [Oscillospiraceae bacterium MB08-C2-2]|nr:hypothetical protein U6B65_14740 [Oscillospiraceae bacterium MB08-C2-2]